MYLCPQSAGQGFFCFICVKLWESGASLPLTDVFFFGELYILTCHFLSYFCFLSSPALTVLEWFDCSFSSQTDMTRTISPLSSHCLDPRWLLRSTTHLEVPGQWGTARHGLLMLLQWQIPISRVPVPFRTPIHGINKCRVIGNYEDKFNFVKIQKQNSY